MFAAHTSAHLVEALWTSLLVAIPATIAAAAAYRQAKKGRAAAEGVHTEVKTNHGKRHGQYIEDVAFSLERLTEVLDRHLHEAEMDRMRLATLEDYLHLRIHDMLGAVAAVRLDLGTLRMQLGHPLPSQKVDTPPPSV